MFDFWGKLWSKPIQKQTTARLVNLPATRISTWSGNAWQNDIFRAAVDAIARNAGKLKATHVITTDGQKKPSNDGRLNRLLQIEPNRYMTAYDCLYKLATQYFVYNNAFALIERDERGQVWGIYPINYTAVNFLAKPDGALLAEFHCKNNQKYIFQYSEIIHLRRHFSGNELLGDNNQPLTPALDLAHTQNEALVTAIRNSANLRGILSFNQVVSEKKAKQRVKEFVENYLSIENSGGVIPSDAEVTFTPLENIVTTLDAEQTTAIKQKIFDYLGIGEKIVNSTYSEDEFAAFYESVIEPLSVQLSLEFTRKIFTERERAFGNQIVFESGRLQFTSNQTKINLLKELLPMGIISINQGLEILNLPPIADGDKRLQSLNYIDSEKANQYQMAMAGAGEKNDEKLSFDGAAQKLVEGSEQ